ncbi:polysaccharide biosynthesis protein [Pseudopedobacter saltans DSM 12145]|uniref:Polysaccharide biosynthesis protein n=1 Tax=Pseudopedobacter saltans (strain ATCC 51119 / DSM 12145 / JCM 21818 / CCUG 39354 / LMG 10337 / NBRC 100064 / NCIMB 13643) TaxID=762903 RepID=F0SBA8_PSESL|nr:flippase [Pseudopedobacter saltans]ADY53735.1 polysaccharide biosynthesis protein [Pseudopedobacter saltans DSM 12145]
MKFPVIPGFDANAFQKYLKNTGFLLVGKVGSLIIKMLVGFAVANYLGKAQNGILNYANSFVIVFLAIAALGLDQFVVREFVKNEEKKETILGTSVRLKLLGVLLILPLIYCIYPLYSNPQTPVEYVLIVALTGFFQAFNVLDSFYQAQVKAKNIMIVNIVANILSAILKLLFIFLHLPIIWFIWAFVIDAALLSIGYCSIYRKKEGSIFDWHFNKKLARNLLSKSWPLMFSAVLVSIYMKIDQLMIGRMLGEDSLGIYSTVVPLSEAWYFVPIAIVSSVFPAIITAKKQNEQRYQKRLQNLYDLMVLISVLIALMVSILAPYIYKIAYKPEYFSGASVLSIHVWAGVFVFLGSASGQFLINEGYTNISLYRTAIGAAVNICLNLLLLPLIGIKGAAWASLIAYACATFTIFLFRNSRKQGLMMLKSLFFISLFQQAINWRRNKINS